MVINAENGSNNGESADKIGSIIKQIYGQISQLTDEAISKQTILASTNSDT